MRAPLRSTHWCARTCWPLNVMPARVFAVHPNARASTYDSLMRARVYHSTSGVRVHSQFVPMRAPLRSTHWCARTCLPLNVMPARAFVVHPNARASTCDSLMRARVYHSTSGVRVHSQFVPMRAPLRSTHWCARTCLPLNVMPARVFVVHPNARACTFDSLMRAHVFTTQRHARACIRSSSQCARLHVWLTDARVFTTQRNACASIRSSSQCARLHVRLTDARARVYHSTSCPHVYSQFIPMRAPLRSTHWCACWCFASFFFFALLWSGDDLISANSGQTYSVMDTGIMFPAECSTGAL